MTETVTGTGTGMGTVAAVMTRDPVTVAPHTPFKEILGLLAAHGICAVPVVSATGLVLGVVSEVDLLRDRAGRHRGTTRLTAVELMASPVVRVSPADTLERATRILVGSGARQLLVVDDGQLVGVLAPRDVLGVFRRPDKEIHAEIETGPLGGLEVEPAHPVRVRVAGGVVELTGCPRRHADMTAVVARIAELPGVVDVRERTR